MKTKHIFWAFVLCPVLAFGQGTNLKITGNNNFDESSAVGSLNYADVPFITNNQKRFVIDKDGNIVACKDFRVRGRFSVGDSSITIAEHDPSQGFAWTSEIVTTDANIAFGFNTGAFPCFSATGAQDATNISVGVGGSHHSYKLHVEAQNTSNKSAALLGFTNNFTGHTENDGLTVGLPSSVGGTAVINQQEDADMVFFTANTEQMTITANGEIKINSLTSNNTHLVLADKDGKLILYKLNSKIAKITELEARISQLENQLAELVTKKDF